MSTQIDDRVVVQASAQTLSAELEGEMVILHTPSGQYYGLNDVGTRIWQIIQGSVTLRLLVERLKLEYNVEYSVLEADVRRSIAEFEIAGLVKIQRPQL